MSQIQLFLPLEGARPDSKPDVQETLRKHGKSFHYASRLLDQKTALRCARLYAFCRHLDDIADETPDPAVAARRLEAVKSMLQTGVASDPLVEDFIDLSWQCRMDPGPALALVQGLTSDLGTVRLDRVRELHRYCYRVAGTVGLMMCAVLGVRDPRALPFAIDLGMAMQMTNIARDVAEDARLGRRYLPAEWVTDLEPARIHTPDPRAKALLADGVNRLLHDAERYYASACRGLIYLPPKARLGIRSAAMIYRHIGAVIRQRDCRTWQGRAVVPNRKKFQRVLVAISQEASARAWKPDLEHDPALHASLTGMFGAHVPPGDDGHASARN